MKRLMCKLFGHDDYPTSAGCKRCRRCGRGVGISAEVLKIMRRNHDLFITSMANRRQP